MSPRTTCVISEYKSHQICAQNAGLPPWVGGRGWVSLSTEGQQRWWWGCREWEFWGLLWVEAAQVRALRRVLLIFLTLDMWNSDQSQVSPLLCNKELYFLKCNCFSTKRTILKKANDSHVWSAWRAVRALCLCADVRAPLWRCSVKRDGLFKWLFLARFNQTNGNNSAVTAHYSSSWAGIIISLKIWQSGQSKEYKCTEMSNLWFREIKENI